MNLIKQITIDAIQFTQIEMDLLLLELTNNEDQIRAQHYFKTAIADINSTHYLAAAQAFIAIKALSKKPLILTLHAGFHAANNLVKALLHGEYDDYPISTEEDALVLTNSVLTQAEDLLTEVITHVEKENCSPLYLALAKIQRMQARYQTALDSLHIALVVEQKSSDIYFECAQLYEIMGLIDEAKHHFHFAHETDPTNELIMKRYSIFLRHHYKKPIMNVVH